MIECILSGWYSRGPGNPLAAGFLRAAKSDILCWMRSLTVSFLLLVVTGCHGHHDLVRQLPVVPVPIRDSQPAPVSVEPRSDTVAAVTSPTPAIVIDPAPKHSLNELLLELADAYFDLDQHALREDSRAALRSDAALLKTMDATMLIEGHSDERGSAEYNLALGAMRAEAGKEFLVELGIPAASLKTITYGKERPQCTTQDEACWQKNRRAHLSEER
jgi:peptidoglycan-associated lipoprotein